MKKFLALFLALVLTVSMVACTGGSGDKEGGKDGDIVNLSIGIQPNAYILDRYENALTKWVESECGVKLTFVEYAGGTDVGTQISTTIAGRQELPDILFGITLDEVTRHKYGQEGYFVNLADYFEDREGASKTFWERFETELNEQDQENVLLEMIDPEDGAIYALPGMETSLVDGMNYQTWINTEWLDKVGKEKPTNKEELLDVLRAFKNTDCNGNGIEDEIPLYGSVNAGLGGHILDWIINFFVYYDQNAPYLVGNNGKLTPAYTTDKYREALQFMNQMYKEGLLPDVVFTAGQGELKQVTTPASGVAMAGIFVGHLTVHCTQGSEVLKQYEPLQTWGCAVRRPNTVNLNNMISADCDNPDKAFEVMMKLWSQEGSYRLRYGEKGVNWTDPDEGAVSAIGLPATLKIIKDPLTTQNTVLWGSVSCTLNVYAEAESAQTAEEMDEWMKMKLNMHAESNKLFNEAGEKNNPEVVCPRLALSVTEKEETSSERLNISGIRTKARADFIRGDGRDINNDADWNAYLKELNDMGLAKVVKQDQKAYDRQ